MGRKATFQEVTEVLSVEKDIGERLRRARESMGLSLEQLQEKTKIQKSFLVAIENGEFSKLPSPFYVRTYLRAYCKCVKMEPHHILRQYRKAEQAERGLTSVQPAITPEMLAQIQQQQGYYNHTDQLQNTTYMAHTGQHQLFAQTQKRPTKRISRINMNTALTIAKKPDLKQNQMKQHQKTEITNLQKEPIRPSHLQTEQTRKVRVDYTQKLSPQQTRHTPSIERTQKIGREHAPKKTSGSVSREEIQKKIRSTNQNTHEKLRPQNKSVTEETQAYGTLSRKAKQQSELMSRKHSPVLDRKQSESDLVEQKVTKMPRLSRSAARRSARRASKWSNKKTILLVIASLAICIPLLWVTVNALATDDANESGNRKISKDNPSEQPEQTSITSEQPNESEIENENDNENETGEEIVLTSSSPQLNTYEVSGTDQLNLRFQADGESWIQVRKQPTPQKQGYLDEATLQPGHEDSYSHNFADGKEIWISLGIPDSVRVTVNGKRIKSSKTIHIKQK